MVEVASGRFLTLAPSLRADTSPVWSHDGRRLAFRQESTLAIEKGTTVSREESTYVVQVASGAVRRVMGSVWHLMARKYLVRMGERCHSWRPQVKLWPHVWRPWATTDDIELEQARRALVEAAIAAVEG